MYLGVIFDIEAIYVDLTHVASRTEMDERNKSIWQVEQDLEWYITYTYHLSLHLYFSVAILILKFGSFLCNNCLTSLYQCGLLSEQDHNHLVLVIQHVS